MKPRILVVDDEIANREFLADCLSESGFEVLSAENGIEALGHLAAQADIEAIVLDRVMPKLNGMELLARIKQDPRYQDVPVIMQTAAALPTQIQEGIQAGAYYYLTKPYDVVRLKSIIHSAMQDAALRKETRTEVRKHRFMLGLIEKARFRFRTLLDAKSLAYFVANSFPDPESAVYGLTELMINAIEHGNLGISYAEKLRLIQSDIWLGEVERRLRLPENVNKFAHLEFEAGPDRIIVTIEDNGPGFDWQEYLSLKPERATDPIGRGIAMARMISFSSIRYMGNGNRVEAAIQFHP